MRSRAIKLLVAVGAAMLLATGVALAAEIDCTSAFCLGTQQDDDIRGNSKNQTILTRDGADFVDAFGGKDTVRGGPGNDDSLEGAEDSDVIYGDAGNDTIDAAANDRPAQFEDQPVDKSFGGDGDDTILAQDNNKDTIDCGNGNDTVFFDEGLDQVNSNCEARNPTTGLTSQAAEAKKQSESQENRR